MKLSPFVTLRAKFSSNDLYRTQTRLLTKWWRHHCKLVHHCHQNGQKIQHHLLEVCQFSSKRVILLFLFFCFFLPFNMRRVQMIFITQSTTYLPNDDDVTANKSIFATRTTRKHQNIQWRYACLNHPVIIDRNNGALSLLRKKFYIIIFCLVRKIVRISVNNNDHNWGFAKLVLIKYISL